jgi:hypothetical protein
MLVGIDESGRGPVIGPLVVCAVAVSFETMEELEALNLRNLKSSSCLWWIVNMPEFLPVKSMSREHVEP